MNVSSITRREDADISLPVRLNFEVIDARAADILGIPRDQITDRALGELFGKTRETVSRLRNGKYVPSLETAMDMAEVLELALEAFAERVRP